MERCLIVVTRDQPELWRDLTLRYAQAEEVEILLDRRQTQRWQLTEPSACEPLGGDRRRPPTGEMDLRSHPFVVVPRP